ncbi:MAG: type II toxin-antitoxin system VapC family toxin [Burkholderiales bacterium]
MIVDACVWLAAYLEREPRHTECAVFLRMTHEQGRGLAAPSLLLAEIAGALARQTRNPESVMFTLKAIETNPRLIIHPVTVELAQRAAAIAGACFLRGADAVYVALASQTRSVLITIDEEIIERAQKVAKILTPRDWVKENGA